MPKNAAAAQKAKEKREKKQLELQIKQSKEKCDEGRAFLEPEGKTQPQYGKALALFDAAIELFPENAEAFTLRATTYLEQKQPEQAIEDFTKALSLNPQSIVAYEGREACYEMLKQWDKAIADCSSIIAIQPENDHAFNVRGSCRLRKRPVGLKLKNNDFAAVVDDFTTAIKLNENNYHAYANLGKAYEEHAQYKKAIDCYSKALRIRDDYGYALFRRGCAAMSFVESSREENRDLSDCSVPELLQAEEEAELRAKENKEILRLAIQDLTRVIGEDKDKEMSGLVYRGSCYHMAGEFGKAEEDFSAVRALMSQVDPNQTVPGILEVLRIKSEQLAKDKEHAK